MPGPIGDGRADDTAALQALLDGCRDRTGCVALPLGNYRLTSTLVYRGDHSNGLRLMGEHAAAGPAGTILSWDGPEGGTVLRLLGACSTRVCDLAVYGNGKAACGVDVSYDHERQTGTTGLVLYGLVVGGLAGPESAAVRLGLKPDGTVDNYQVDYVRVAGCTLVGWKEPGTTSYGIATGWANAKNFTVRDTKLQGFRVGVKHGGSGFMLIDGCNFLSSTRTDVAGGPDCLEMRSCESEGSSCLYRGTTGQNAGAATLTNVIWDGAAPAEDVVAYCTGALGLRGCQLNNRRTPTSVPRVQLGAGPGIGASLDSAGSFYLNAKGSPPFIDGSGHPLKGYRSFGDFGGVPGGLVPLKAAP
jgi:hypothetical protein